jgi:hypothetical protein
VYPAAISGDFIADGLAAVIYAEFLGSCGDLNELLSPLCGGGLDECAYITEREGDLREVPEE